MIFSHNNTEPDTEFKRLMHSIDLYLNEDSCRRPNYYKERNGKLLEDDVCGALIECAKGGPFEGTIEKVSGQKFPDIVANKYYGVEVKSTKEDKWKSTGSSILESTRITGVERIYMTFCKLGGVAAQFLSRPYEECLSGIAVTHMPRYLIDMHLAEGETIFDKMGVSYEELRRSSDPVAEVTDYFQNTLRPGESLWWARKSDEGGASAVIRLWRTLPVQEKKYCMIYGCVNFPEVFGGDYDNYSVWLLKSGIACPNIRDQFSAGGKMKFRLEDGRELLLPAVYYRIKENRDLFIEIMKRKVAERTALLNNDKYTLNSEILEWIDTVSRAAGVDFDVSELVLRSLLF